MVCQFYANVRQGSRPSEIISHVNCVDIILTPNLINQIFNTKIEEGCRSKIANFFSYEELPTSLNHFDGSKLMKYFKTSFKTPNESNLSELDPLQQILFTMVSNLLVSTNGHCTDTNKMELYLFYYFMEKIRVDFDFILCHAKTDTRRKLSYAKFLTLIFKHFNLPFLDEPSKEKSTHFFTKSHFCNSPTFS